MLQLFPYHLSDYVCRVLRVTPFKYYCDLLYTVMREEKSYDQIPNFAVSMLTQLHVGSSIVVTIHQRSRQETTPLLSLSPGCGHCATGGNRSQRVHCHHEQMQGKEAAVACEQKHCQGISASHTIGPQHAALVDCGSCQLECALQRKLP